MNIENDMNEEVHQLLDSLEEHGKNARRQKGLIDLIDSLEASEGSLRGGTTKQSRHEVTSQSDASTSEETSSLDRFVPRNDAKRRRLIPLWWTIGAAAACLLLWLLVRPSVKQVPEMNEEILVEETKTIDSVKTKGDDAVFEERVINEELLAEETPVVPEIIQIKKEKPKTEIVEEMVEQPVLAEVISTEPTDTTKNIGSNPIPTENETPSTIQKPQRRVIRSLNLVCYECQKDPEPEVGPKPNMDNRTLFGQPQDPNMKNGSLAFEFKLN